MKVLIVGDIIGRPGREIFSKYIKKKKSAYDFVVINGENSAGGFGITRKVADDLFSLGVDIITGGNHIWDKKETYDYLDEEDRLLRPLNYPKIVAGSGSKVVEKNSKKLAVINIQGRVFMNEINSPFETVEEEVDILSNETKNIIVDFHAEASSEKMAMGWFLDGKVSVVYGTHTHVMTADNRIFPRGTGYITDIGMTGGFDGIIGMKKEEIIEKFLYLLPRKFQVCNENVKINGIEVEIDEDNGECISIERIDISDKDL